MPGNCPYIKPIYVWDMHSPAIRPAVVNPFSDRTDGEMSEKGPASMSRTPSTFILRVQRSSEIPTGVDLAAPTPDPGTSFSHTSECEHSISLSTIIIKVVTNTWSWFATHANCSLPLCARGPVHLVTGPRCQAREGEIKQRILSSQHPNPSPDL